MAKTLQNLLGFGVAGALKGAGVAMIGENIFNNESIMNALTKPETLYFAGACAIGNVLYHGVQAYKNRDNDVITL